MANDSRIINKFNSKDIFEIITTNYTGTDFLNNNNNWNNTVPSDGWDFFNLSNEDDLFHACNPALLNTNQFNCTRNEYLRFILGPQTLPLVTALLVTVFFVGIFITGFLGNIIVCIVIVKQSALHNATNYYLFSLAVSDLIYLLGGLPYEISLYWHQYPYNMGLPFCKIRAFISEASSYVSVLTIVAFSMERFLAICHPLHLYTMSGFKRALRIIAALWIISFLSAVPFVIYTKINYIHYPPNGSLIEESAFCAMLENPSGFPLWELSFSLFFVIPMVLIMVLYGRMGCQIRSRTKRTQELGVTHGSMHKDSKHQSKKAIIRMLAAVVITFFVCWTPFHIQRLAYLYLRDWQYYEEINTWLFSIAGWFYYVSCTINPILYNIMSHRYRIAFKETLCGRKRSYYGNSNGFGRDQSSFRETIKTTVGSETSQLIRSRSSRSSHTDRYSMGGNNLRKSRTESIKSANKLNEEQNVELNNTSIIVIVGDTANGRPKVLATNEINENLNKKNETYI